jgi:hypothetical protein
MCLLLLFLFDFSFLMGLGFWAWHIDTVDGAFCWGSRSFAQDGWLLGPSLG